MNTPQITDLIADAKLALETIECGKSPVFRKAAAAWLESIAKQLQGACAETEPEEKKKPEEPPATIDLRMKYRTRDGHNVCALLLKSPNSSYPLQGIVQGRLLTWTATGRYISEDIAALSDLVPTGELA
jgi:hypothetical protein